MNTEKWLLGFTARIFVRKNSLPVLHHSAPGVAPDYFGRYPITFVKSAASAVVINAESAALP